MRITCLLLLACVHAACLCSPRSRPPAVGKPYLAFKNPTRVTVSGYEGHLMEPFISRDGRLLLFNNLNNPKVNTDLHHATRVSATRFRYAGRLAGVNSPALEGAPSMDRSGAIYFVSPRDYERTRSTIYRGMLGDDGRVRGVQLVDGVSQRRAGWVNFDLDVSPDGQTLYFVDSRFGPGGKPRTADLVIATRAGGGFRRLAESARILAAVNSEALEYAPCISRDGLELFFTRVASVDGRSVPSIYVTTRDRAQEPFGPPRHVTAATGFVEGPTLSPDERRLYFHRREGWGGRHVLYVVSR